MKFGWVGFHMEGREALSAALRQNTSIEAVLTLEPGLAANKSGAADYQEVCSLFRVPLYFISNINDERSLAILRDLSLDFVFVIGWTQLVGVEAMRLVRGGMIGAHASLLPSLRGRAPVNWALIRGLTQTGNTLLWLSEKADRGDIIDQMVIPIRPYDTCASLYEKVAETNKQMILRVIPRLANGERPGRPQAAGDAIDLPRRRPEDGLVDWSRSNAETYNFIRALTRPYPGAISWLDNRRYRLWQAALVPGNVSAHAQPGDILGPVVSPRPEACGIAVACKTGTVVLLEVEDDDGRILMGPTLSDQPWTGKRWGVTEL